MVSPTVDPSETSTPENANGLPPLAEPPRLWPGDPDKEALIEQMIRVNQAGEFGAARIYAGQISVLGDTAVGPVLREMAAQEQRHLETFNQMIVDRQVRPTVLTPLWHIAGFALGAATARLGTEAAMACTVAVEEVIDEHYAAQAARLKDDPSEVTLKETIDAFREEELEHRDTALAHDAESAPAYPLLSAMVKAGSRAAIWLSTRI